MSGFFYFEVKKMKYLVISDIHGVAENLKTVLDSFKNEFDVILCCGDFLYHGPRNGVPEGYDPKQTMDLLESVKEQIIGVRGNCDGEVDQMVLNFPLMAENQTLPVKQGNSVKKVFIHHGHKYSKEEIVRLVPAGSIIVSGHTHVCVLEQQDDYIWFNPGSVSLPKCDEGKTCGLITVENSGKTTMELCSITGEILKTLEF